MAVRDASGAMSTVAAASEALSELSLEELAVTVSQVTPGRTQGIGAFSKGSGKSRT